MAIGHTLDAPPAAWLTTAPGSAAAIAGQRWILGVKAVGKPCKGLPCTCHAGYHAITSSGLFPCIRT